MELKKTIIIFKDKLLLLKPLSLERFLKKQEGQKSRHLPGIENNVSLLLWGQGHLSNLNREKGRARGL